MSIFLLSLLRLLIVVSSIVYFTNNDINNNEATYTFCVDDSTYAADKKTIEEVFYNNIEYFRVREWRSDLKDDSLPQNYFDTTDCGGPYYLYSYRVTEERITVSSPRETRSQLKITADTIFYNRRGDRYVAFVIVKTNYDTIPGYLDRSSGYNGHAVVGYRDDNKLKVYPMVIAVIPIRRESKESALRILTRFYFHHLKGSSLSSWVCGSKEFQENLGDKDFFEKSLLFQKYDSTRYNFQMYSRKGREYHYKYGN